MNAADRSGPAFPAPDLGEQDFGQRAAYTGMTLRDYAAIEFAKGWIPALAGSTMMENREQRAAEAVRLGLLQADAFLEARQS